jgi:hypothetical protein
VVGSSATAYPGRAGDELTRQLNEAVTSAVRHVGGVVADAFSAFQTADDKVLRSTSLGTVIELCHQAGKDGEVLVVPIGQPLGQAGTYAVRGGAQFSVTLGGNDKG